MKIVVIGGTGLIGSKLVSKLREQGHQGVAASPASGVNTLTGEGLAEALDSAAVVVDVSNSPSFEAAAVLKFFETSTGNLLEAEATAGVGHHVALSVVGTERLSQSGYFRAKIAQEKLIKSSDVASVVGRIAVGSPVNGIFEIAGPQQFRLDDVIRLGLKERNDPREVIADPHARYFGAELGERTLMPGANASLAETRFEDWLNQSVVSTP